MADINVGDTRLLFITFYDKPADDVTRQAGDPDAVTLTVRKPDGTLTEYTAADFTHTPDSGYYEIVLELDQGGRYDARWEGTGGVLTSEAEELHFRVRTRRVPEAEA